MKPTRKFSSAAFGEMIGVDSKIGSGVEWLVADHFDRPLRFAIIGDNQGPKFQCANVINSVLGQKERIENVALAYLKLSDWEFSRYIMSFELEWLCFDDNTDSSRYIASFTSEFGDEAGSYPPFGCAGNGFWDLDFRMVGMIVERYILEDCPWR